MCSPTQETHIPSVMCSPTWETHIPSDMCSPTWETHIPSDMCSPTWETRMGSDIYVALPGKHISRVRCVPPAGKQVSLVIGFSLPGKHIFLVMCVPLPAQHICKVICFSLPGKHISLVTWVVLPIEIKKSRWQHASFSLQVQDWPNLSSILTADLSFEYMDIKTSKKCPWTPSFLSLSTSFCQGIQSSVFLKSTRMGYWFRGHEGERNNINNI